MFWKLTSPTAEILDDADNVSSCSNTICHVYNSRKISYIQMQNNIRDSNRIVNVDRTIPCLNATECLRVFMFHQTGIYMFGHEGFCFPLIVTMLLQLKGTLFSCFF